MHVLSATPQTWLYGQEASAGVALSVIQNDDMARLVKEHPDRFSGIATLADAGAATRPPTNCAAP